MRKVFSALFLICIVSFTVLSGPEATVAELVRQAPATNSTWRAIHGKVVARGPTMLTLDDGTGLAVCPCHEKEIVAGDVLSGAFANYTYEPGVGTNLLLGNLYAIRKTGHGEPPPPSAATLSRLFDDDALAFRTVSVEGVVTDVATDEIDPDWIRLTLESEGRNLAVTYFLKSGDVRQTPSDWIDAAVRITGYYFRKSAPLPNKVALTPRARLSRKNLGGLLLIEGTNDIRRLVAPQSDAFRFPHREEVTGLVLATWDDSALFLRTKDGLRLHVHLLGGTELPPVGSIVTLAGFCRSNDFFDWLSNASVRTVKPSAVAPEPAEDASAFVRKGDRLTLRPDANGRILRIAGRVKDIIRSDTGLVRLTLDADGANVTVEAGRLPTPPLGSRIAVTGACLVSCEPHQNDSVHVRLTGVSVIPRVPEDFTVLARPPWWTPGRLLAVICALLAGLVGIFLWNRALRRLVERRGRQLLRAQLEGERSALRIGERTRLAVELHDALSQNLAGVGFQLDSYRCARDGDPAAAERHLTTAERILGSCRSELRRCLWDLRSDALEEQDFAKAVRKILPPVTDQTDVSVSFDVPRALLSDSTAHAILRILRELTANAVVHGKARHVRIAGSYADGLVRLSVADDGCGFDPQDCPGPGDGHFGVTGIRERLRTLKGTFDLTSQKGQGTEIRITLPVATTTHETPA